MQKYKGIFGKSFFAVSLLATLFIITEMVFQAFGKSICQTGGCQMVTEHTRFGDFSVLFIGLGTFAVLSLLSFLVIYKNRPGLEWYINSILIISLAAEGFFAGYQAFRLSTACIFCLITMGFFMLLGVLRLLYGEKELLSGFGAFAGIFALFYLILPVGNSVRLPEDELVLFYSKECKFCTEVIKQLDDKGLKVAHVPVGMYSGFLQSMGIEHVPTLYVNRKNQKIYLTGREAIYQYLDCSQKSEPAVSVSPGKRKEVKSGEAGKKKDQKAAPAVPENSPNDLNKLLAPQENQFNPFAKPEDPGMCKQTEKCD
ncbi:MAG: hypothetical protein C0402_16410 [Thermodesulfovibrio sp.]|nr:hypothetical protein [Thermodesulfovibrio sp.]